MLKSLNVADHGLIGLIGLHVQHISHIVVKVL